MRVLNRVKFLLLSSKAIYKKKNQLKCFHGKLYGKFEKRTTLRPCTDLLGSKCSPFAETIKFNDFFRVNGFE